MDETSVANVQQFAERALAEAAATAGLALARVGDRLGLWQAMAGAGPLTSAELAQRTGTAERYVREWLACQAAGGYVTYDPATGTFTLPEEVAAVLAVEDSPAYGAHILPLLAVLWKEEATLAEAFRTGVGIGWHQHHPDLLENAERLGRVGWRDLVPSWIPALDGVAARLEQARGWPTWTAAAEPPRSSWPRLTPTRASGASTSMTPPSPRPARPPPRPASATG